MTQKKIRDIGAYNPETDGTLLYYAGYIACLASTGLVLWFIHTYVGWWNFLLGLVALVVLGVLVAPRYFQYLPELHFTSLDSRPHHGEVYAYEYGLDDDELDEVEALVGLPSESAPVVDATEKAEVVLWKLFFLAIPGFMFFGWLLPGSTVTLTTVIASAVLSVLAFWWWSRLLGLDDQK